ncbi:helix-turn-helix transcriptional regulator [Cupriavidus necator]
MLKNNNHLVGDLYEAAFSHEDFLDALQRTAEAVGANMFHMLSWDSGHNCPRFSHYSPGTDWTKAIEAYDTYYGLIDPRREMTERAPLSTFVYCQDFVSDREVARSEFYQDYLIPLELRYLMGAQFGDVDHKNTVLLGFLRGADRLPYTDAEKRVGYGLTDHLHRAINLWQDSRAWQREAAIGTELMQQLGLIVFALSADGHVVFADTSGEGLLRQGTMLRVVKGKLAAPQSPDNDALAAAIARVTKTHCGESLALRDSTALMHNIFLSITPLPIHMKSALGEAVILITARQRDIGVLVTARQLQQAFGFTPAEAAVAEALIDGISPEDYSETKQVSLHTVRSQVRAILLKTNTRSQVKAVSTMLWVLSQRKVR